MRVALVLSLLSLSACASPLAGSAVPSRPAVWSLSGQSNAVGLAPALATYAVITGAQQNSTHITAWDPDQPLWIQFAASLPTATAVIWWQGEADAADPARYAGDLTALLHRVRQITAVPLVICGANRDPSFDGLRAVQQLVAARFGAIFVPADDLPIPGPGDFDVPTQQVLPASVSGSPHLSVAGYAAMAARIANALH